jgi:hypothetical protein
MTRRIKTLLAILALTAVAWAADVVCPLHPYAACYNTGQISPTGSAEKWHCSCGDDVWMKIN